MCYSAMIRSEHRRYEREYGVQVSLRRYVELFWEKRRDGGWLRIPKAMRADFAEARTPAERELAELAAAADGEQARVLEAELFRQKARLAEAERALAVRASRKAEDEQRIATDKIARAQRNLADLQRSHLMQRDARIFPGHYAPLIIWQDGGRVLVPMRYQCRLPGWSEADERRRPGTYNARRDNLGHAWRKLFGHQHGVLVVTAFFENVARHKLEHRPLPAGEAEENVVLEFSPQPPADMLLACLWSYSPGPGSTRSRPSPTSRRPRSRPPATTVASFPCVPGISTPGSSRIPTTCPRSRPSSTTARRCISPIGSRPSGLAARSAGPEALNPGTTESGRQVPDSRSRAFSSA